MRRLCSILLPGLAVLACLGGLAVIFANRHAPPPAGGAGPPNVTGAAPRIETEPAVIEGPRRPASAQTAPGDPVAAPTVDDFDAVVEELVGLGMVVLRTLDSGSAQLDAHTANDRAEELLLELRPRFGDPEAHALDRLTRLPDPVHDRPLQVRRGVLLRIVRDGLATLHERGRVGGSRRPLEAFVTAMLAALPADEVIATELASLLTDAPYLSEAHESAVLSIAEAASSVRFLRPIATGLIRSLWRNLRAVGARTESEIAAFALLLHEDLNPSRRLAALEELLVAADGRYRTFVVEHVRATGDRALATELAEVAARELAPDLALDTLSSLHPIAGAGLVSAFLAVGERDAHALELCYEQHLADATRPALRAELVSGALAATGPDALALAATAFDHDPDAGVRARALYALAAHPSPAVAEDALRRALDDPRTADDPDWFSHVAGALRNLAGRAGTAEALQRIGTRLSEHPRLDAAERLRVRAMLAEHLPRGGG